MLNISREDGFTLTEMLVSTTVMLLITGAALTTFKNATTVNDAAAQLSDANQNLRAGTNELIRDLMMAGRIIGAEGIAMPAGAGVLGFNRPGPGGTTIGIPLVVDEFNTLNLPSIATGFALGGRVCGPNPCPPPPSAAGTLTDLVTIMTIDEFMPVVTTPPVGAATVTEGTIAPDGKSILLPAASLWIMGDTVNDTVPIQVGDLIFFKGPKGNAIQTVTSMDATHIYFADGDYFNFNQSAAPVRPLATLKGTVDIVAPWASSAKVTLFRAMMITYYVDNTTTPGTPRLTRLLNNGTPQALAGVVEDLDLTYDLVDSVTNPANVPSLPWTDISVIPNVTYNSAQIRKVNIHVGVRSEVISKPNQDFVRNHISTSVDVRSLASVDRYKS